MKKLASILLVFIFSISCALGLDKIAPLEAFKLQQENKAIIVDVREADEVKNGMVKDALFMPLSLMKDNVHEWEKMVSALPKDKTIIVYCRSGRRSGIAGEEFVNKGLRAVNMGGFEAWKNAGLPLEK